MAVTSAGLEEKRSCESRSIVKRPTAGGQSPVWTKISEYWPATVVSDFKVAKNPSSATKSPRVMRVATWSVSWRKKKRVSAQLHAARAVGESQKSPKACVATTKLPLCLRARRKPLSIKLPDWPLPIKSHASSISTALIVVRSRAIVSSMMSMSIIKTV